MYTGKPRKSGRALKRGGDCASVSMKSRRHPENRVLRAASRICDAFPTRRDASNAQRHAAAKHEADATLLKKLGSLLTAANGTRRQAAAALSKRVKRYAEGLRASLKSRRAAANLSGFENDLAGARMGEPFEAFQRRQRRATTGGAAPRRAASKKPRLYQPPDTRAFVQPK